MYARARITLHRTALSRTCKMLAGLLALGATLSPSYSVGLLDVTWNEADAGATLDIQTMRLVFEEQFDAASLRGPKIFAPVHSSYGAATFDPPSGEAYSIRDGYLTLKAYRKAGRWRSGSVQTADAWQAYENGAFAQRGFACRNCYFEARLRFPKGNTPGLWGGFWLLSPESAGGHTEIDVIEWYGGDPKGHHQGVHLWPANREGYAGQSNYTGIDQLKDGEWHTYGAQLDENNTIRIFMDRKKISEASLPAAFQRPYYAIVSLTILPKQQKQATGPFFIECDYIRAYR